MGMGITFAVGAHMSVGNAMFMAVVMGTMFMMVP